MKREESIGKEQRGVNRKINMRGEKMKRKKGAAQNKKGKIVERRKRMKRSEEKGNGEIGKRGDDIRENRKGIE